MGPEGLTQACCSLEAGPLVQRGPGCPTGPETPALIKDATAAAHSPQHTAATQERFGLSRGTAAISKETSMSLPQRAEQCPTEARTCGGAANLAAGCCGSKRLSPHSEGETPRASGHQHHVEDTWVQLTPRD